MPQNVLNVSRTTTRVISIGIEREVRGGSFVGEAKPLVVVEGLTVDPSIYHSAIRVENTKSQIDLILYY